MCHFNLDGFIRRINLIHCGNERLSYKCTNLDELVACGNLRNFQNCPFGTKTSEFEFTKIR